MAGTIVGTHLSGRSGNLYLNFHQDYGRFLSVKIPAASVSRFPADAQNYYKGKEIIATGEISTEGAAHYLPAYAGNLDIMTSAGLRTAERMAQRLLDAALASA